MSLITTDELAGPTDEAEAAREEASDASGHGQELPGLRQIASSLPVDHGGTTVYLRGWRLEGSERPPIVIVHDLAEHADLYRKTSETFVLKGYSCYAFDLRGHGRSGRRLGHAPSFGALVRDLLQVAAWIRHEEGGRAPIILGHGIGALIAMEFVKRHGAFCRAAILSAPCFELVTPAGVVTTAVLRLLAEFLPTLRLPGVFCPRFARELSEGVRRDAEDDAKMVSFPRLTAVFAHELLQAIKRAETRFLDCQGTVLILCPDQDRVVTYGRLKRSVALHQERNLRIADLPGVGHQVFTGDDAARESAFAAMLPWLDDLERLGEPRSFNDEIRLQGASRALIDAEKAGATKE